MGRSGGATADLDATAEERGELGPLCRYFLLFWPEYQNFGIQKKTSAQPFGWLELNLSSEATSGLEYKGHYRASFAPHIHILCLCSEPFLFLQIATVQAKLQESQIPSRTASDWWVLFPIFSNPYGYRYLIIKVIIKIQKWPKRNKSEVEGTH